MRDSIAQLVEHITFNDGVLGSSPSRVTKDVAWQRLCYFQATWRNGRLASLRGWCSQGRVGSNPTVVTRYADYQQFKTVLSNICQTVFFVS